MTARIHWLLRERRRRQKLLGFLGLAPGETPDTTQLDPEFTSINLTLTTNKKGGKKTADSANWSTARASVAATGKVYFEAEATSLTGSQEAAFGLYNAAFNLSGGVPGGANSAAYQSIGQSGDEGTFTARTAFVQGERVMFAWDQGSGKFWVGRLGVWVGDPAAGTGHAGAITGTVYPGISLKTTGGEIFLYLSANDWVYSAPAGWGSLANEGTASPADPLSISGTPVTTATEGVAYAGFTATASGGATPYSYSLVGTWPTGISVDPTTGAVSGTPTVSGSFAGLSVRATDGAGATADLPTFLLEVASATATDPNFASVSLLASFDGTDGATTATDDSTFAHTLTFAGNAQIDTATSMIGGASLLLDGTGDGVLANNHPSFLFGSGQFTVECFVRMAVKTSTIHVVAVYDTNGQRSWGLEITNPASRPILNFTASTAGTSGTRVLSEFTDGTVDAANTWFHIAADRDASGVLRIYQDGNMLKKVTYTDTLFASTGKLSIGGYTTSGAMSNAYLNGSVDEVRITKGVARYASDAGFTVPTEAYPRS